MLGWSLAFLIIAFLAALLGFTGITGTGAWIARGVCAVFLALFAVLTVGGSKRTRARLRK